MGLVRRNKGRLLRESLVLSMTLGLIASTAAVMADEGSDASSKSLFGDSPLFTPSESKPLFESEKSSPAAASTPSSGPAAPSATALPSAVPSGSTPAKPEEFTPVNPLKGLFQMQPQYPTPGTTQMFPEAVSPNMGKDSDVTGRNPGTAGTVFQTQWKDPYETKKDEKITPVNPIKGLFQQQPQYPTPGTTQQFPEAIPSHLGSDSSVPGRSPGEASTIYQTTWKDPYAPPEKDSSDKTNYLKGLFQQQPQYPSPNKTPQFPEAIQKNLGDDSSEPGRQPGTSSLPFGTPQLPIQADAVGLPGINSVIGGDKKEGTKEGTEEKKEGSGEKKEGEDKDKKDEADKKDDKDKDKDKKDESDKKDDKDKKDSDKKDDKDKKDSDKKDDKDKKDSDKKDDKDKKDSDKKDDKDKKDSDKKDEKKEEVKYAPYNPLREAISLMNSGKYQDGVDLLTKEIKKQPNNPQAFYTRAVVYVRMRRYPEAAKDYNQVLTLVPQGKLAELAKAGLAKIKL